MIDMKIPQLFALNNFEKYFPSSLSYLCGRFQFLISTDLYWCKTYAPGQLRKYCAGFFFAKPYLFSYFARDFNNSITSRMQVIVYVFYG